MSKPKHKTVFICQQCGKESPKWLGRCPNCHEWNSFVETEVAVTAVTASSRTRFEDSVPQELSCLATKSTQRLKLPAAELNRVLGDGLVPGSLVLIGGDPGIGKSTLLLQVCSEMAGHGEKVLYISGEESSQQIKLRAQRLGIGGAGLFVLCETRFEVILKQLEDLVPALAVVDSIQTMYLEDVVGMPGSVAQIRECTLRLMQWVKQSGTPAFITGHVTKDGAIAGPRALEHIVDTVLYLEGEASGSYRILRSTKNRFGSTNEVGVFEMTSRGLKEVPNPSEVFLTSHRESLVGSAVVSTLEGSRPLLVEVQALTNPASFGPPRRIANGIDLGRLLLIAAVLSRRASVNLSGQDVITNIVGGLKISEPAADLGIALAIASSFKDREVLPELVAMGEIGLSGELRPVPQIERRIAEAVRLGFRRCLVPAASPILRADDAEILRAANLSEALKLGLSRVLRDKQGGGSA